MKKYKFAGYERTSMNDYPLSPGQMCAKFVEAEDGKLFSDVMNEYLDSKGKSIKDVAEMSNLLKMKYALLMEIKSGELEDDDIAEIAFGFKPLDEKSKEHRCSLTSDPTMQVLQNAKRPYAALHYIGIPIGNVKKLCNQFDGITLDLRDATLEELDANIVPLMSLFQREQPAMYIISTEVANALMDSEKVKNSPVLKQLDFKASIFKNVFASKEGLENNFIRTLD